MVFVLSHLSCESIFSRIKGFTSKAHSKIDSLTRKHEKERESYFLNIFFAGNKRVLFLHHSRKNKALINYPFEISVTKYQRETTEPINSCTLCVQNQCQFVQRIRMTSNATTIYSLLRRPYILQRVELNNDRSLFLLELKMEGGGG